MQLLLSPSCHSHGLPVSTFLLQCIPLIQLALLYMKDGFRVALPLFIRFFGAPELWLWWPLFFIQEPVRSSKLAVSFHLNNGSASTSKVCQSNIGWTALPCNRNVRGGFCYLVHSVGHKHFLSLPGIDFPIQSRRTVHPHSGGLNRPSMESRRQVLTIFAAI